MTILVPFSAAVALVLLSLLTPKLLFYFRQGTSLGKKGNQIGSLPEKVFPEVEKETDLPEGWWTSEKHFALEQRAIFSKKWLYMDHTSNFSEPGTYRNIITPAGYHIFLIKGRDHIIRAFHNVCRHRAYAVTSKPSGRSLVLGCRYHGWSYDTKGKLIKAPKFDEIPGFDKEANSLFPVDSYTDNNGMIFVNLDAQDNPAPKPNTPRIPWSEMRRSQVEAWNVEGGFNWKVTEYESSFLIPSLQQVAGTFTTSLMSLLPGQGSQYIRISPLSHIHTSPAAGLTLIISVVPLSAMKSNIECTLFSKASSFENDLLDLVKQDVLACIKDLEKLYSKAVESSGFPHIKHQANILAETKAHAKLERVAGREIRVATKQGGLSGMCKIADDLCKELEMGAAQASDGIASAGSLEW